MLYIILERIKEKVEREVVEEQAGSRPGRGTGDMVCAIQILIEKLIETRNEAYIIFIVYGKAFDSVNHSELFTTLSQMGLPNAYCETHSSPVYRPRGQNQIDRFAHRLL